MVIGAARTKLTAFHPNIRLCVQRENTNRDNNILKR